MRRFLFLVALFATMPVFADDICPAGYQPSGYVELEYVESTGTQWIDTGLIPTNVGLWQLDAKFNSTGTAINGVYQMYGSVVRGFDIGVFSTGDFFMRNGEANNVIVSADLGRHLFEIDSTKCYIDGTVVSEKYGQRPDKLSIYIFARRSDFGGIEYPVQERIYSSRFYNNNSVLIQKLIPVKRIFDNEVCMYDTVTGRAFFNQGTGAFIAGPERERGSFFIGECAPCPDNTYKPNAGNDECTPCPVGTFSPIGSTSLSDCAKILHVGNYVAYMPVGRRTEHGLCTMFDGKKYCADIYEKQ